MNYTKNFSLIASVCAGALMMASCGEAQEVNTDGSPETTTKTTDGTATEATFKANSDQSEIRWEGNMVGLYSHTGTLKVTEGEITLAGDKITGGSFTVDMGSMTPTDENYKPEEDKTPEKLVGHLSSPDFFDVANYPNATAKIVSVDGNQATIDLTIRGKTNTETLQINDVSMAGGTVKANGAITFDRQKYGVAFKHPMQEMVLSDKIVLNIDLIANK